MCWYRIVIIPYFQRPRHRDRKRYGSHSIAPGLRRGVSLRGRTAMRAHGMGLPLLLRMAPSQNSPGWGPRPQTLPSAWLLEAHLLGWLGRYPLSHKLRGPALPSASPPCLLRLFLVQSLLRGGRVEAWMLDGWWEGTPVFSLVLCPSVFVYHPERYPNHLTSASATVWPAVRFSNHGVPHPLCPPKLLILIIMTP